ncbi:MAG: universal stress protein [Chloroflexota bacterium]|nr:universal stress protein [Chloroflexota bacterium]
MTRTSRYKKIVVPLDGSGWARRVIPDACDIARMNSSEIILVHIFQSPAREFIDRITLAGQEGQIDEARAEIEQHLHGVRHELEQEHITVRAVVLDGGGVVEMICAFCAEENVDLIIMSTHGRTGLRRLLFGSVARELMECSLVPVMLIQPDKAEG